MSIPYRDYLHKSCEEQIISNFGITNPRIIGSSLNLDFTFEIKHELDMLQIQSEVFLSEFRRNPDFVKKLDSCISLPYNIREDSLQDCYKYSYFKAISIIKMIAENGYNAKGILPYNSYLFFGHKRLIYIFLMYNVSLHNCDMDSNITLQKILQYNYDSNFSVLENDEFFKKWNNDIYPIGIYNRNCERILEALSTIDGISVELLSQEDTVSRDAKKIPLGNMCFDYTQNGILQKGDKVIRTVTIRESLTDHVSKFWNLANGIYLKSIDDKIYVDFSSPYITLNALAMSKQCYFAMVESITGMKCGTFYSTYGSGKSYNGDGKGSDNTPTPPKGKGDKPIKPTGGKTPGRKKDLENTLVNRIKAVSKGVGNALNSDQVKSLAHTFANELIIGRLKENQMNRIMDKLREEKVLISTRAHDFGIPIIRGHAGEHVLALEDKKLP